MKKYFMTVRYIKKIFIGDVPHNTSDIHSFVVNVEYKISHQNQISDVIQSLKKQYGFEEMVILSFQLLDEDVETTRPKTGIDLIAEERQRQIEVEGWTAEHDQKYTQGELVNAAVCYALPDHLRYLEIHQWTDGFQPKGNLFRLLWTWAISWWKPTPENRIRELQKAGALIAAEIDRLLAEERKPENVVSKMLSRGLNNDPENCKRFE